MIALFLAVFVGQCGIEGTAVLTYGDSKTVIRRVSETDSNIDDWQGVLQRTLRCRVNLNIGTVSGYGGSLARNGWKVADCKAAIDADLAVMHYPDPAIILFNIGTNDLTAMLQAEADWKADLLYILDALHVKWPSALVYLPHVWKQGEDADADTLAGWKAAVIAARATFVKVGHDERIWAKGADDGATMYHDGIHYSRLGAIEHVAQWRTVLGW